MLHNEAVSSKLCIKNGPYDSKLHEKCSELVKDRIFKVKVKVYQLLKSKRFQKPILNFYHFKICERLHFNLVV